MFGAFSALTKPMPAPTNVGGQAVLEGVMMRAASGLAVAVRRQNGEIIVKDRTFVSIAEKVPFFKIPGLRGIVVLIETLCAGYAALGFSAEQAELGEKEQERAQAKASGDGAADSQAGKEEANKESSSLGTTLAMIFAIALGIGLFVALPHGLTMLVGWWLGGLALKSLAFHLVAGGFKLAIFVTYLSLLSMIPDIRRVFMYHGAEHKVIATYEAGDPLDVEHARKYTTFHARCGTSFLLVVVVVAILLFAVVFPLIPWLGEGWTSHFAAVLIKIPLLLPVAGFAYELNRWASKHLNNRWVRALVSPGFLMQRLTTREPTDEMLEVSISSLKAAIARDKVKEEKAEPENVVVYRDFADVCSRLV